jgi:predicted CXXCH cytochrome family protein
MSEKEICTAYRDREARIALVVALIFAVLAVGLLVPRLSGAEDNPCLMCHEALSKEKVVHQALAMGCVTCHSELDTNDIPHKVKGKIAKGLAADQPDLCYGCHDKAAFSKKNVHAAVGMGCTGCHNPHSSKNDKLLVSGTPDICYNCHDKKKFEGKTIHSPVAGGMCTSCHSPHSGDKDKLLVSDVPDVCFNCHDKANFSKKNVHMPVAGGMCTSCHFPHAGEQAALLLKPTNALCSSCHKTQSNGRHVSAGSGSGLGKIIHPVEGKPDPGNPGKDITCASCHSPHSSDFKKLWVERRVCNRCHKY